MVYFRGREDCSIDFFHLLYNKHVESLSSWFTNAAT